MADQSHLDILQRGVEAWNSWRERGRLYKKPDFSEANLSRADLTGADLTGADLSHTDFSGSDLFRADLSHADLSEANLSGARLEGANLSEANLSGANLSNVVDLTEANLSHADLSGSDISYAILVYADLSHANLSHADLSGADLEGANLTWANLTEASLARAALPKVDLSMSDLNRATLINAYLVDSDLYASNLSGANLSEATLSGVNLSEADLSEANLSNADLRLSNLVKTNLKGATLTGCSIYGISAWSLILEGTKQQNLNVSDYDEPAIMVDNLEVGQFIYLLLNNEKVRQVIDTITSKLVLILGRFTAERKAVLDAIRDSLRQRDYLPVVFDFDKPASRDLTETISTLAHMARFVIADITDAKSLPQELQAIVPNLPSVPVQPLLLASEYEYGMFEHFKRYPWVLEVYRYDHPHEAITSLESKIISPAEAKARELSR